PVMGLMSARVGSVTDDFLWYAPGDGGTGSLGAGGGSHRLNPAFELSEFSFGAENPTTIGSATGGAGGGKAGFAECNISKLADAHFLKNCPSGAHCGIPGPPSRPSGPAPGASAPCLWCTK